MIYIYIYQTVLSLFPFQLVCSTNQTVSVSSVEPGKSRYSRGCCLPTPLTLVCGGGGEESDHRAFGPPASLSIHLASSSITPAGSVHKSRDDNVVHMWVQLKRGYVSCVWKLERGHSGDGCVLAWTLCKYDLKKGYLFVLSWARVRRVMR